MTLAAPSSGAGGELKTRQVDQLQYLSNTHMFPVVVSNEVQLLRYCT